MQRAEQAAALRVSRPTQLLQGDLQYLSRDALVVLLEAAEEGLAGGTGPGRPLRLSLLDVRRHDEAALYGALPGALGRASPRSEQAQGCV